MGIQAGNTYGIFAAYFVGMLMDLCVPSSEGNEGKVLDLIILCTQKDFLDFLFQGYKFKKTQILSTNEDVKYSSKGQI